MVLHRPTRLLFAIAILFASPATAEVVRYTVRAHPLEVELQSPNGGKTIKRVPGQASHFLLRADREWPVPDGDDNQRVRCEIRWTGFPAGWKIINSFGSNHRHQRFETTLGELRKAVFAGGDFRLVQTRDEGVLLAIRGTWRIPDLQFAKVIDQIARFQKSLWRDRGLKGHVVFLLPTDESVGHWGGEGRSRSLVLEASKNTGKARDLAHGLAHELFHEWNPRRLKRTDYEELYWFTEGVTEYYAALTLSRLGIWTFDQVVSKFNSMVRQYYGSPARNLPASAMVKERLRDPAAERLPYLQGYLMAAQWNAGGQALDKALPILLRDNRQPLSNDRIAKALARAGIRNALHEIERFIVRGETVILRPGLWGPCAVESQEEVRRFDIGFDLHESRRKNVIHGAKVGSNAWHAGVRDGQRWTPLDVAWGDPGHRAELEVSDAAGTRRVSYLPAESKAILAPQYSLQPFAGCGR